MQFGVFDHMDRGEQDIGQQYRDRLQLIATYEGAGFHAYHRAEHHGTPLSVARPETTQWAASQRMNIVTNGDGPRGHGARNGRIRGELSAVPNRLRHSAARPVAADSGLPSRP